MSDDRAERLRNTRNRSRRARSDSEREKDEEPQESNTSSKSTSQKTESGISKQYERDEASESSVKDEQVGTYMYLPKKQKKEIDRRYAILKAEYEYEFEEDFEKNRHFFPLIVQYGLEGLEDLDASDIKEHLGSL